ncbi:MAG: hypothetical protein B6D61_13215 [Bacteroidetes bacterium 4484_249]|nr:MAG: hypothetical protein B6D61_13215 [Bacteroidetes bacterium 4484_249]
MKKSNYLKVALIAIIIPFFANSSFAQGAYFNLNVGYGLGIGSSFEDFYNETDGSNSTTYEKSYVALGKGLNFGGDIGFMFNKNIGAELGISYLLGGSSKAKDEYNNGTTDYKIKSRMLRFIPSIVVSTGLENVTPFAKFGIVVGTGSLKTEIEDNDDGDVMIIKEKYKGGMAFGFKAAVGAIMNLSDMLSFYIDINTINAAYAPKKSEITEYTYKGEDKLPDLNTYQKETEYVKEYTYNPSSTPSDTQPRQALIEKYPMQSFGINAGVILKFGGK